ncbi:MAG: DUF4249 domain-containing protein [Flavisolibacter sp.]|nr:DUF4249 domain-containing protein [Flavisolibacter sp.]
MHWLRWILLSIVLISCEKGVDFKLDQKPDVLVVDASIENDTPPVVVLTKSLGYFSQISSEIVTNSFVHNADIFISNGQKTQKLKEHVVSPDATFKAYYYTIDSSNLNNAFLGQLNSSYSLRIVTEGKEYEATTTIPNITKRIDSLWWKPVIGAKDTAQVSVLVKATDPKGFGDYIRYWTKRNSEPFLPAFTSAFDDLFIDGTTYELELEPGIDRNREYKEGEQSFRRGDTVVFKISNIDKATFDFWRTMEYTYASVGNPFSSPIKVLGNISNGALGYFGGYASQYHTLIITR